MSAGSQKVTAESLALSGTRLHYVYGWIDADEFERRVAAIIGLDGDVAREYALHRTEYLEVTCLGGVTTQQIPFDWRPPLGWERR